LSDEILEEILHSRPMTEEVSSHINLLFVFISYLLRHLAETTTESFVSVLGDQLRSMSLGQ
jgi:hypothetical protein